MNSSNSKSRFKETVDTSITAQEVNADVKNETYLQGATIASVDSEGNDNNNLNLKTNTLKYEDLSNTAYSNNKSTGGSVSFSTTENQKDGTSETNVDTVSAQHSNDISLSKYKTLSTIGEGNLEVENTEESSDLERLNRDITNTTKEIYDVDRQKGDVDITVDARIFTKDGRAQIAEDFLKTKMIADSFKTVITNDTLDATDVFQEIKKRNDTYEAVKAKVMQDSTLAQMLNSPAYTQAQKDIIVNGITNNVLEELGYKPIEVKFIATTEPGRDGEQVKGFYSTQTNTMYINTLYSDTNYKLLSTSGTEAQRAMDAQEGSTFDQDDAYRAERSKYSEEFGSYLAGYTNFALANTGQGSLSTESNPSNLYSEAINDNNAEFATLDKTKGDNLTKNVKDDFNIFIVNNHEQKEQFENEKKIALDLYIMDSEDISNALENKYPPLSKEAKERILTSITKAKEYDGENSLERAYENLITDGVVSGLAEELREYPPVGATLAVIEGVKNGTILTTLVEEVIVRKIEKVVGKVGDKVVEYGGELYASVKGKISRIEVDVYPNVASSGGLGAVKIKFKKEVILPSVNDYNQARNQAQNILGDLGAESKPYISRLRSSSTYGKVVGRESADGKKRWRLDYDPKKGLHINVEDFSKGKSADKVIKRVIPIKNGNIDSLIKHLNK